MAAYGVAAMYRFVHLPDPEGARELLLGQIQRAGLCGTLLVAEEGLNGTIAGPPAALRGFVDWLRGGGTLGGRFAEVDVKWSTAEDRPFRKTRVRVKREIVTLGVAGVSPVAKEGPGSAGRYVDPAEWDALLDDPGVTVVDTRNDYEVELGTFIGASGAAINPQTESFRGFPAFVREKLDPGRHRKVAMFCTGGIRCEKSTAYLKAQGFEDVVHLKGGILRYLEEVPAERSRFRGACFVFDRRVAVTHGLAETEHELCFACGWPTTAAQRSEPTYRVGVSCPRCVGKHTAEQEARFGMRQAQTQRREG
ncbi:MAG: rhodanese-related sulfurtransferase [Planctomycetota bacterium]